MVVYCTERQLVTSIDRRLRHKAGCRANQTPKLASCIACLIRHSQAQLVVAVGHGMVCYTQRRQTLACDSLSDNRSTCCNSSSSSSNTSCVAVLRGWLASKIPPGSGAYQICTAIRDTLQWHWESVPNLLINHQPTNQSINHCDDDAIRMMRFGYMRWVAQDIPPSSSTSRQLSKNTAIFSRTSSVRTEL
jgi:hypothetical protein